MTAPNPHATPELITPARVAGVLLAGGRSTRFGAEKAVASFNGAALMDAVLAGFADLPRVAVSARPNSAAARRAHDLALAVLVDDVGSPSGPLAGVAAGLEWAARQGFAAIATAPCDAPLLPSNLALHLVYEIGAAPAAYATTAQGEHPLCALWRVELRERLATRLTAGEHPPVRGFLKEIGASPVYFEDARAFANANTADALAALECGA